MSNFQEQINILVEVQGVELEIHQADRLVNALSNEAAALDQAVAEREAMVSSEKAALDGLRKAYRDLESEAKVNAEMVVKSNEKLRAVKTNKEYQSILKEIDEIRKKNSGIEDRMLEQLETIESAEASVKSKEAELAGFVQSYREKKEMFAAKEKRERQSVEALNEKKARISANADPQIFTVLDDVKKKVRGLAVVPVQQAICMGCHMNIPAQLFNELQRFDELRFCPHCHRIIYWKEQG
ncbi:zinc ribbon domain-containing protein [Desulfosarcina sp.]|uniref:zinc ribbon domain-containing protein n=1 Tax=Desulfosarcina sp. TaxID=2027861 RepID=UPI0029B8F090|nr:C4-type zinc ribbon domain-containing protein [Desulfosarcina sp.]MDX2451163.1 C4-type zinc ribbon domain-containing protein [Desulfosarcina sp.]MDX2489002.1 C4-type zinc ribbon domain-containing protein [Desulfosarcina sp.]